MTNSQIAAISWAQVRSSAAVEDSIMTILLDGIATTMHEAEEVFLNGALDQVAVLCGSELTNEQLAQHALMQLLISHGSRGWEDSLL